MIFVLHNIRSAWNVGSIFRTADAVAAQVVCVGYTARPQGKQLKLIQKTAIGAEKTVHWQGFDSYQEVFQTFSSSNFLHIASEITPTSQNCITMRMPNTHKELVLWFGNEIHGLDSDIYSQCQYTVHLPMQGKKESLNVANTVTALAYVFLTKISSTC